MSALCIDLETKPNESLRELFMKNTDTSEMTESDIRKAMATDHEYCEIVCIGIKQVGGSTRILDSVEQLGTEQWNTWLEQMPLLTFHGKRFDLPILIKHGMKAGVDLPYERLNAACKPWGYGDRHVDLLEILAYGGKWKTLDHYLEIYLGINKETKGLEFFDTATVEQLKTHCEQDLDYTIQLAEKFRLV